MSHFDPTDLQAQERDMPKIGGSTVPTRLVHGLAGHLAQHNLGR